MPADGMTAASQWDSGTSPSSLQISGYAVFATRGTTPSPWALPARPWGAAEPRDFCPNHLARLSYVVESSINPRPRAPAGAAREQEFRGPISVPSHRYGPRHPRTAVSKGAARVGRRAAQGPLSPG